MTAPIGVAKPLVIGVWRQFGISRQDGNEFPGEFCLLRKNQLRMHCRCLGDCPELLHHVVAAKPDKRVGAEHTLGGARSDFVAALWR